MPETLKRSFNAQSIFTEDELRDRVISLQDFDEVEYDFVRKSFDDAYDKSRPFGKRLISFIAGESKLGRGVGTVLDIATVFLPSGVRSGRWALQRIITKKTTKTMGLNQKKTLLSKTVWSAILIALIAILNALGVDFVNDPEVMQSIWNVGYALAGAFGLYGLRDAIDKKRT